MIIIPGIGRSGTSFLTKKIHEAGNKMYETANEHYEDEAISIILYVYMRYFYMYDYWYANFDIYNNCPSNGTMLLIKRHSETKRLKGFKDPRLIFFVKQLKVLYQNAKFIFCIRDFDSWRKSHIKRGRGGDWDRVLGNHYSYCMQVIESQKGFIFQYEKGHEKQHQKELMDYLGFKIDMSEWRTKSK